PLRRMHNKGAEWKKASAVVLGHSNDPVVQTYVADALVGKEIPEGRVSVEVEGFLKPGGGVTLGKESVKIYRPQDYGMDPDTLNKIDEIVLEGIKAEAYPGCQVLILKDGVPVYDKCFGSFTYEPSTKVSSEHLYDLASLTKTTATLLAVMKLYDEGKFGLTDRISKYVPVLQGSPKERITVEELLLHQSGLPAFWPFYREAIDDSSYVGALFKAKPDADHRMQVDRKLYVANRFSYKKEFVSSVPSDSFPLRISDSLYVSPEFPKRMLEIIASDEIPLRDRRYRYSCLNFMLLKEMVECLAGEPLNVYLEREFYRPMGMENTLYKPLERFPKEQIVPTIRQDYLRNRMTLQGYVHDEIAAFMGGVSGNAGLFSNARDVAKVYQMLIDGGMYNGKRYFSLETCNLFMTNTSHISRRGLGFDKPEKQNPAKGPCAEEAPEEVVGHTGFTGTCAWADPKNGLVFVFLSNRIYPRVFDHKALMSLNIRPRIQQVMYQALRK
ncbi:MAG: serine hydrolase, partial [Bacteroidaceae bacterium]|nr:serine hydrolase [Bacteroidaceae bacterium]